jgi:hypothetical protein
MVQCIAHRDGFGRHIIARRARIAPMHHVARQCAARGRGLWYPLVCQRRTALPPPTGARDGPDPFPPFGSQHRSHIAIATCNSGCLARDPDPVCIQIIDVHNIGIR